MSKRTPEQAIDEKIAALRADKERLELEEAHKIQIPFLRSLVGKCLVYRRNSYSCPEKKSDYWDVYRRVLDCIYDGEWDFYFIVEDFCTDSYGKSEIKVERQSAYINRGWFNKLPFSGFVECDPVEYEKQRANLFKEMLTLKRCREGAKK